MKNNKWKNVLDARHEIGVGSGVEVGVASPLWESLNMRRGFEKQIIAISHFELGMAHPYWLLPGVRPTTTTTSRAEKKPQKTTVKSLI